MNQDHDQVLLKVWTALIKIRFAFQNQRVYVDLSDHFNHKKTPKVVSRF